MNEDARHRPDSEMAGEEHSGTSTDQCTITGLLSALEADYAVLLRRLSQRLKSQEAAQDALHDTYVKLRSHPDVKDVRNYPAYLYRMSLNLAKNHIRDHSRTLIVDDVILSLVPDIAPDPEQVASARLEMERAFEALQKMPERRRQMFLARWRDGKAQAEIAADFGLHKRSVQKELTKAELVLRKVLYRPKS